MRSEIKHYRAYAKINLCLAIAGVRQDGYHLLDMVNVEIGLADRLTFSPASTPGVNLTCNDSRIPVDERNLIHRAIGKYIAAGNLENVQLDIALEKSIPAGGGLGGGSMDAAATLRFLQDTYHALSDEKLLEIAAAIGADVPFGLIGGAARVKGIGDELESLCPRQLNPHDSPWIAVLAPDIHSDTRAAYQAWDRHEAGSSPQRRNPRDTQDVVDALQEQNWSRLSELLFNDLQMPVFQMYPQLQAIHAYACATLQRPVLMTGSGSNLFTIFTSQSDAKPILKQWDFERFPLSLALYSMLI